MFKSIENYCIKALLGFFLVCMLSPPSAYALKASADTLGGYSAQVLEKVLTQYVQPIEARGSTLVLVRIASDGRPYSCEIVQHSQNRDVDEALCVTIARVGKFEEPRGLANVEVALNFVYEDMTRNAMNARQVLANPNTPYRQQSPPLVQEGESVQASESLAKKNSAPEQNIGSGIVQKRLDEKSLQGQVLSSNTASQKISLQEAAMQTQANKQGMKSEVEEKFPAFESKNVQETLPLNFAQEVLENVKPYLQNLPNTIAQGKYRVTYRIKTNAYGQLTGLDVVESSNNYDYDTFVQDIILVKNVIPRPRDSKNQEAIITFIAQQ